MTREINHDIGAEDGKPLWVTGKAVIMGSGLCLFRGLIGIFEIGVYGSELVNKCRYCTTKIYTYGINYYSKKIKRRAWMPLRKF